MEKDLFFIRNKELSLSAKGVMAMMLQADDMSKVTVDWLLWPPGSPETKESVQSYINELKEFGYLEGTDGNYILYPYGKSKN